jgi:hypothetical protein
MSSETQDRPEKHRASRLTISQQYALNVACKVLQPFGWGTYHVGSSLTRSDYHDVDLRCIMPDDEYARMFGDDEQAEARRLFLNAAVSEWLSKRTGLPIDFQFQTAGEANSTYAGGRRNAVGH